MGSVGTPLAVKIDARGCRGRPVEEVFGWLKTVAALRKTRHRGQSRVGWIFTLAAAAYNLVRMRNLTALAT